MRSISGVLRAQSIVFLGLTFLLQASCVGSKDKHLLGVPCDIPPGTNAMQAEQHAAQKSHMIFGEVLRIEGMTYVLKDQDGKEINVSTDETTEKPTVSQGDRIAANVDNRNHALWIRANRGTDRRTEHASADCRS